MNNERLPNSVGGTTGGLGEFVLGLLMATSGAYLLTNQVVVQTGFWSYFGYSLAGPLLLLLLIGLGLLFFNGRSLPGWGLTLLSIVLMLIGVIVNLQLYFRPASLFFTIFMLTLLGGGIGLIARSLRPH
jgi:FtsH-binding integral membrane protein